jgi:hypothetical protein
MQSSNHLLTSYPPIFLPIYLATGVFKKKLHQGETGHDVGLRFILSRFISGFQCIVRQKTLVHFGQSEPASASAPSSWKVCGPDILIVFLSHL